MTTWEDTWKDITIEIPTLLPLGAVPQQPDPGEMLQYIQGLHNYIADDRQKLVRALNVLGRFRLLQTDDKTDGEIPASGSGAQKLNTVTGLMYYDDISQEANSGALWKPVAAARSVADFFNGSFVESFDAVVSSDGATITLSLEQDGTGDLTCRWSTGDVTLDCTPAQTIALTAGTDTVPVGNFVYIPRSTKVLTKSTSNWPSEEHIKVAYVFVRSAATTQTDGPLVNQNWNDHVAGTDGQGHMTHMAERSRRMGALWYDGVSPTYTAPGTTLDIALTAGSIYQMHKQTFPAFDTATGSDVHVANDSVAPYSSSTDPETLIQADSTGATLVVFAVANKGDQNHSPVFINLPSGSYNNLSTAVSDTSGYDNFQMPSAFGHESSTGFLVSRLTLQWSAGLTNLTLHNTVDLRGYNPLTASGGSGSLAGALLQDGSTPLTGDWDTGATYGIDAAFLISKGDVTIEDGDLFLDATANPTLYLREGGSTTSLTFLEDTTANNMELTKVANTGAVIMDFNAKPTDGTSDAIVRFFRETNTTGTPVVQVLKGDNSTTVQHSLEGGSGDADFCQQGGNVMIGSATSTEGDLYIDSDSNPTVYLREGADASNYSLIQNQDDATLKIRQYRASGDVYIDLEPWPSGGTDDAQVRLFRAVNTTGANTALIVYKADASSTVNHRFYAKGDASLCLDSGDVHIGSGAGAGGFKVNISASADFIHCDSVDEYIEITLQSSQPIFSGYMHNDTGSKASQFTGWRSGGTKASPTATGASHAILKIGARPHDGTGWTAANKAQISISTVEAITATAQGTKMDFQTTEAGTTTLTGKMRIGSDDIEINRNNYDYDLIIDGDTTGNVIRMDAANHRVGINVSAPNTSLEISGDVRVQNGDAYMCENFGGSGVEVMLLNASNIFNSGHMSYRTTINSVDVVRISATDGDPGAGIMGVSEVAFYLDESGNNLMARVKYAGGTDKTGTVCALT
jgi:hypothetical protein